MGITLTELLGPALAEANSPRTTSALIITVDQMQSLLNASTVLRTLKDSIEYHLPLAAGQDGLFAAIISAKQNRKNVVCRPISQTEVLAQRVGMMYTKGVQIADLRIATDEMFVEGKVVSESTGWTYKLVLYQPIQ